MDNAPENSVVAKRYAARRQAELAASVPPLKPERPPLNPNVGGWVAVILGMLMLYGYAKLAFAFPVIFVIVGIVGGLGLGFSGRGLRWLFTTTKPEHR